MLKYLLIRAVVQFEPAYRHVAGQWSPVKGRIFPKFYGFLRQIRPYTSAYVFISSFWAFIVIEEVNSV